MEITQELITPAKAEELLKLNRRNRTLRRSHVMKLARAIVEGEWQPENPAPIAVNGRELVDGQHRLAAVIEAEKSVKMWVARGTPTSVRDTLDTGLPRLFRDTLTMNGFKYPNELAAVARQMYLYKTERLLGGGPRHKSASHAELMKIIEKEKGLIEFAQSLAGDFHAGRRKVPQAAITIVGWWLFGKIDGDAADAFMWSYIDGTDLSLGDPAFALRRLMFESQPRFRPRERVYGACLIKAWNAFHVGEQMYLVKWRNKGKAPEPFPEIR